MNFDSFAMGDLVRYTDDLQSKTNWQSLINTYNININMYFMLSCNRFKWESKDIAPLNRMSRLIEYYLGTKGQCFIDLEEMDVKQGVMTGNFDSYGNPEKFNLMDYNGKHSKIVNADNVIWIKNNDFCIPTIYFIIKYCNRINKIEKTMDLNIDAQKTPFIIETDPLINYSVKNMFNDIENMANCVLIDQKKGLSDNIKILDLNVPFLVNQLYDQKINEENELMRFLGIDTVQEKNSHLLYAEIQSSNEIVDNFTDIFVEQRKTALKIAKEKGIDLKLSILDITPDLGLEESEVSTENEGDNNIKKID